MKIGVALLKCTYTMYAFLSSTSCYNGYMIDDLNYIKLLHFENILRLAVSPYVKDIAIQMYPLHNNFLRSLILTHFIEYIKKFPNQQNTFCLHISLIELFIDHFLLAIFSFFKSLSQNYWYFSFFWIWISKYSLSISIRYFC